MSSNSQNVIVNKVTNSDDLLIASQIRHTVFVAGQGCPAHLEIADDEVSVHFLATVEGKPAGAARWRSTVEGGKLERFAVLPEYRGKGVGQALVKAVLADIPADTDKVYLNAQLPAVGLYLKFGFETVGDQFEEAGMLHYRMLLHKKQK